MTSNPDAQPEPDGAPGGAIAGGASEGATRIIAPVAPEPPGGDTIDVETLDAAPPPRGLWVEIVAVACLTCVFWLYSAAAQLLAEPSSAGWDISFAEAHLQSVVASVQMLPILLYLMWRSGRSRRHFGFALPHPRLALALMVLAPLVFWAIDFALAIVWWVLDVWAWEIMPEESGFSAPAGGSEWTVLTVGLIANSLLEEFSMRSYMIPRIAEATGRVWVGVVASSALFASYHIYGGYYHVASTFLVGMVLGGVFAWTRSVWPCIGAHTIWNICLFAFYPSG